DTYKEWKRDDTKVRGNIRLRVTPSVAQSLKQFTTGKRMWTHFEETYGAPGISQIYSEFKSALDVQIPPNANPLPALTKLAEHIERMAAAGVEIPPFIHAMLIISKAPAYASVMMAIAAQADKPTT
ncbi:hypothetical protein BDY19DRAFT_874108, partial [Irpex rosettiformis]